MEFVEVSFPFWCWRKCLVTVPWAASASMVLPSGQTSTLVIIPRDPKPTKNQQQVHICSCICNLNVRVNVQHWTSTRSKLHSKSPTLAGADTYPELQSQTGHLHHSSCTPTRILPQTSLRRRPCRQSVGAHTKSSSPQRPFGIAWSNRYFYHYPCEFNVKNMCRYMYMYILFLKFF